MLEKGRNHLLDLEPPYGPDGRLLQRRDQVRPPPLPRPRPAGRAPHLPPHRGRRRPPVHRRRQQPALDRRRRRLPRRRQAAPLPRGGLRACSSARGPVDGADVWPTGRVDYDELEPYYAEAERLIGVAGEAGANPFAAWRSGPVPDAPGPGHVRRRPQRRGRRAARPAPLPGARPASTPSPTTAGRPATTAGSAAFGCPIDAKGDPVASLRRALRTGRCELRPEAYVTDVLRRRHGPAGHRRPLPRRRPPARTRSGPPTSSSPPGPSRPPACCCATGSATRRTWSAATSRTTSRPSRSGASRSRCTASGAAA